MGIMAAYGLMILSILISAAKNLLSKKEKDSFNGTANLFKVNFLVGALGGVVLLVLGTDFSKFTDARFLALSLVYGASIMLSQITYLQAVRYGSLSVCSLIYCCGFLIPTIATPILYVDEPMSIGNIIGIVLLVASLIPVTGRLQKFDNLKWIPFILLALFFSGLLGLIQKIYAHTFSDGQRDVVFLAFAFVAVFAALGMIATHKKAPVTWVKGETPFMRVRYILVPCAYAACVIFNNVVNMILADPIPAAVFFAGFNGSVIVLTALGSALLLKEKLTKTQYIGIAVALAAINLISVT